MRGEPNSDEPIPLPNGAKIKEEYTVDTYTYLFVT